MERALLPRDMTSGVCTPIAALRSHHPVAKDATDSVRLQSRYPWDFLVQLAREAGIVWWRTGSAKWETVEPEKGKFDFSTARPAKSSACWTWTAKSRCYCHSRRLVVHHARAAEVEKAAGNNSYLRARLPLILIRFQDETKLW